MPQAIQHTLRILACCGSRRQLICLSVFLPVLTIALSGCNNVRELIGIEKQKPNIVVILTDDQRWDTLWAMENVQKELIEYGTNFTNAFVSIPQCCPMRSTFLSGGFYAHNTHVLGNSFLEEFDDTRSLGILLQQQGYRTALLGKYMNGYKALDTYVPPGWTHWFAFSENSPGESMIEKGWFDIISGASSADGPGVGTRKTYDRHQTGVLQEEAISFIRSDAEEPFFLLISTHLPHNPATPAPGDENLFPDFVPDSLSMQEVNLSNKPIWSERSGGKSIDFVRKQLRSLQAIDRLVQTVVSELRSKDLLKNTYVVFLSDNGYLWGEHGGEWGKLMPYEESIRIPLIFRTPSAEKRTENRMTLANLDLPTTILRWAGSEMQTEGYDLRPLIKGEPDYNPWKEGILSQLFQEFPATWVLWRDERYKLIELVETKGSEFYDLLNDPYEMENQNDNPEFRKIIKAFRKNIEDTAGLVIAMPSNIMPMARVGSAYKKKVTAQFGTPPYTWSLSGSSLPPGLTLSPKTGTIAGTPKKKGEFEFEVVVKDSTVSPYDERPHKYSKLFTIEVK